MKRTKQRVYWREQGGARRAYGDFRDYADVGGKREPLMVPGETRATTDEDLADALAAKRVTELQRKRAGAQGRTVAGLPPVTTLVTWVREHLIAKAKAGHWATLARYIRTWAMFTKLLNTTNKKWRLPAR